MAAWLYQMAEGEDWTPEEYRLEVWEGNHVTWPHRKIVLKTAADPAPGEPIVLFFAKSGTEYPGICGLGVMLKLLSHREKIGFRPVFPTDLLKMAPIWDTEIEELVNEVRGPSPRATMWSMTPEQYARFCKRIRGFSGQGRG
jgi:hypothetical protein